MTSSFLSLLIIVSVFIFWIYIVVKITILRYLKLKRNEADAEKGQPVNGTILSAHKTGGGKFKAVKLKVEFPNFAQTPVQEEFRFIDSKPEENRYEEGRRVMLLIDYDSKNGPAVKLAGGTTVIGKGYIFISAVLLSLVSYGTWYVYQLSYSKIQGDLGKTDELFARNESMPLIGIVFIGVLIFQWILFKFINNTISSKKQVSDKELKYYGEAAVANIQRYEDTGVSVNDNPKVKFYYSFSDKNGQIHQGEDSKIIGKLEIGLLPTMKEKQILYLPQSPGQSKFTENLNPQSLAGCLNLVLIFEAFIFSAILIGMYLSNLS